MTKNKSNQENKSSLWPKTDYGYMSEEVYYQRVNVLRNLKKKETYYCIRFCNEGLGPVKITHDGRVIYFAKPASVSGIVNRALYLVTNLLVCMPAAGFSELKISSVESDCCYIVKLGGDKASLYEYFERGTNFSLVANTTVDWIVDHLVENLAEVLKYGLDAKYRVINYKISLL